MARVNKRTIRITRIENMGRNHELWCDKMLMLRTARQVGDVETVNHYVLGKLNENSRLVEYEVVS